MMIIMQLSSITADPTAGRVHRRRAIASPWLLALAVVTLVLAGCASLPPVGDPSNALATPPPHADKINWPEKYAPEDAGFFVHNEIEIHASPESVWNVLIQAETWPTWYEGAADVKVQSPGGAMLSEGAVFTWSTMGLSFTSTVKEFVPPVRLSWESRKASIKGYHGWLVTPTAGGCRLVTEESQHGFLTLMQKIFVPNKLRRLHDVWLAQIKTRAEAASHELAASGR